MITTIWHKTPLLRVSLLITAITFALLASANITKAADATCLDISGAGQEVLVGGTANSGVLNFDSPYEPAESEKACMRSIDANTYRLEGWAWNTSHGWTSLYCGADGFNQGVSCGAIQYATTVDIDDGQFHGYAWNDNTGYITFNCADDAGGCTASNTHVVKAETDLDCEGLIYSSNTYATPANCPTHTEVDAFAWSNSVGWLDLSGVQLPQGSHVTSVSPSGGLRTGGTDVIISGSGFTTVTDVTFGGVSCTNITTVNSTTITCTTPAHAFGAVDVVVTAEGVPLTLVDGFNYINPPLSVTKLGDDTTDYARTFTPLETADLVFSETIDAAGKLAIESAISAGASVIPNYTWSVSDTTLTITPTADTIWPNDVIATVSTSDLLLIDSALDPNQIPLSGNTTVNIATPNLIMLQPVNTIISIAETISQSSIDLGPILTGGTGTLPSIEWDVNTGTGLYNVKIAEGTIVTGEAGWNESIYAPFEINTAGLNVPLDAADVSGVTIGSETHSLTFDKAVRTKFTGKGGYTIGFYVDDTFTEVTSICSDDLQAVGDALGAGLACRITVGNDEILWTKHFTDIITYTAGVNPTISSILPNEGLTDGNEHILILGTNFGTGAVASFDGVNALSTYVHNNTTILSVTPGHKAGAVDVTVTNPDTNSGTEFNGYTYSEVSGGPTPTITLVTPNTGDATGGTTVEIQGTNFSNGGLSVYFGSSAAPGITYTNDTTLNGTTPSHTAGAVDVIVINPTGIWGMATNGYEYTSAGGGGCDGTSGPSEQCGEITIGCAAGLTGPTITAPADVTFDTKQSSPTLTIDTYDSTLNDGAIVGNTNALTIFDERGGNMLGCPISTPGWTVSVLATDLTSTDSADAIANPIPASSLRIITTNQADFSSLLGTPTFSNGEEAWYTYDDATSNIHDVSANFLYDDASRLFNSNNSYNIFANTLDTSRTLLSKPTGQYGTVYTGVALMIDDGIAASQPTGTYSGTITYSVVAN